MCAPWQWGRLAGGRIKARALPPLPTPFPAPSHVLAQGAAAAQLEGYKPDLSTLTKPKLSAL